MTPMKVIKRRNICFGSRVGVYRMPDEVSLLNVISDAVLSSIEIAILHGVCGNCRVVALLCLLSKAERCLLIAPSP